MEDDVDVDDDDSRRGLLDNDDVGSRSCFFLGSGGMVDQDRTTTSMEPVFLLVVKMNDSCFSWAKHPPLWTCVGQHHGYPRIVYRVSTDPSTFHLYIPWLLIHHDPSVQRNRDVVVRVVVVHCVQVESSCPHPTE